MRHRQGMDWSIRLYIGTKANVLRKTRVIAMSRYEVAHRDPKRKLRDGYRAPSRRRRAMCRHSYFCLLDILHVRARHIFHRRVWYRALSRYYACIRRSGIILTPRLPWCQISFLSPPIADLAHGENRVLTHSLTHSPNLFDAPETKAFALE